MQAEPRLELGALFENDLDACAILDQDHVILRVNRAFVRLFGFVPDDAIGQCIDDLIVPSDRRAESEAFGQRTRAGGELSMDTLRLRKDGTLVPVWVVAQPHMLDDRMLVYVQYRDLSEQKRIADSLRAGEAMLRAVFQNAPVGFILADAQMHVLQCNAVFSAMIGYTELELRGLRPDVWNHPEDFAETCKLRAALDCGEQDSFMLEKRYIRREGTIFWGRLTVSVIRNTEGASESYIGVVEDITVARQARLRREAALTLFKSLIETMRDGIVVESHDHRISAVNPAWLTIFGQSGHPEQIVGMDIREAIKQVAPLTQEPQLFLETIERRITEAQPARDTVHFADGRVFERDYSPIKGGGTGSGHLWVYHDLTDLLTLQAQLRQSQKMEAVGRLAGGIAHDFNNLLTVLQGHAALLLEEPLSAGARSDVQEIVSAANKAANVTRQLLAYSRQQVLKPAVLDLNEVVHQLERTLLRMIREDIRLEVDLNEGTPHIKADRTQIEQVVLNLAVNARDAMPKGGALRMVTTPLCLQHAMRIRELQLPAGSYAVLSVTDSGEGIDDTVLPRIFDPFFTTKEQGKGTGLGLSTVYGIVKQSGAFITVDSRKAGGTTFTIYFPKAETAPNSPVSTNS